MRKTGRKIMPGDRLVIDGGKHTATVQSLGDGFYGESAAVLKIDDGPAAGYEVCIGIGANVRYEIA